MPTTQQNHYEVLGVARDATLDEIKKNYRRLARELHPDVLASQNLSPATLAAKQELFKQVTHAYDVLGDAEQRKRYDLQFSFGGHVRFGPTPSYSSSRTSDATRQMFEDLARKLAEDLNASRYDFAKAEQERRRQEVLNRLREKLMLNLSTVKLFTGLGYIGLGIFVLIVFVTQLATNSVDQIQQGALSLIGIPGGFDWALIGSPILGIVLATALTFVYMVRVWGRHSAVLIGGSKADVKVYLTTFKEFFRAALIIGGTLGFALAALQHF